MFWKTAKFRLTLWYAASLMVILCLFAFFMYTYFRTAAYEDVDEQLKIEVLELENSLQAQFDKAFDLEALRLMSQQTLNTTEYNESIHKQLNETLLAWEKSNRLISQSHLMVRFAGFDETIFLNNLTSWQQPIIFPDYQRDSVFMESGSSFQTIHYQGKPIRLYYHLIRHKMRPLFIVQAGRSLDVLEEAMHRLLWIILFCIPGVVLITCVVGWLLVKRAFDPVDHMIRDAKQITAAYLKRRLPRTNSNDELDRLAETLNEMIDRLEISTRAIQDFSSDISHELKTPLAIVRGEIDLALRKERNEESLRETLRVIEGETNELIRLVDDLMLLVRNDSKQLKLLKKHLDLEELLGQVVKRYQERSKEKSVLIQWISEETLWTEGDPVYLKRLFSNLVDNALKFTSEGGNIVVRLYRDGEWVAIDIADNGVGIEEEDQKKIFSRFYRTDSARSQEGAGLGLNIAKAITDAHGGQINIQSQVQLGTTITIRLPLLELVL